MRITLRNVRQTVRRAHPAHLLWQASAGLLAVLLLTWPSIHGRARANGLTGAIDAPTSDALVSGLVDVRGWVIDRAAADGVGIERVSVTFDGIRVTDAHLREPRSDIGAAFGAGFVNSGWRAVLDLNAYAMWGTHTLAVQAVNEQTGDTLTLTRSLRVQAPTHYGVNTHVLWYDAATAARDLDRTRSNGLSLVRFDVAWDRLEPRAQGELDAHYLASLDDALDMAARRGLQPVLTVLGTPAWARGGAASTLTPPTNPDDYGAALGRLAAHLAARPGLVYEIWNEPNQVTFWSSPAGPDPSVYAHMLRSAYASIKAVAPGATVLGGSLAFNDPDYLEAMYAAGAGDSFDGLALHPYSLDQAPDATADPTRSFRLAIEQARQVMTGHNDGQKPIWITEIGWNSRAIGDALRADYLARAVQLARAEPAIAALIAYELNQADDAAGAQVGLVAPDGTPSASWLAFGAAARSAP